MTPRVLSLFAGYGGLSLAVEQHFGGELVAYSEFDPAPSAVMAHHWPGVPNLGDITQIDWHQVARDYGPINIIDGGYPCQPFSLAGARRGVEDERHLWPHVVEALRHLRPSRVVFENVRGHLSIGFDEVLRDLAWLGYDAEWRLIAASEIGAPHRRQRLFIYGELK